MNLVHIERGAIDEPAVDRIDGKLQGVCKFLRAQAKRMVVVAMHKDAVGTDPPAHPQRYLREISGSGEIVRRQMLAEDLHTAFRWDLDHAIAVTEFIVEHGAQDSAIHLDAVHQDGSGPASHAIYHEGQSAVV